MVAIVKLLWGKDKCSPAERGEGVNCDIKVTQVDQLRPDAAAVQPKSRGIVRSQPAHPPFIFWLNCGFSATDTGLTVLARKLGFP